MASASGGRAERAVPPGANEYDSEHHLGAHRTLR